MHVKNAGAGKRGYLTASDMQTWQGSGCVVDFLVTFFLVHAFVHWKKLRAARCKRTPERLTNHSTDSWTNSAESIERYALELKSYPLSMYMYANILLLRIVSDAQVDRSDIALDPL